MLVKIGLGLIAGVTLLSSVWFKAGTTNYYFEAPPKEELALVSPIPSPLPSPLPSKKPKPTPTAKAEPAIGGISAEEILAASTSATPIIQEMETPEGIIRYKQVIKDMWAMSYDSTCEGCDTITATGMKQGFGVVAVDPKVISLYTKLYIPGYGKAVAGDVGGAIKGKKIDLGYDSLMGQWQAHWVDVYILAE